MTYRLYTKNVRNNLTNFNDNHYHILASKVIDNITIAVIYNEDHYIVAYNLKYDVLDSIHWGQGHYFDNLMDAVDVYKNYDPKRQIAIIWDIDDVKEVRPDLTDEQAMDVLLEVEDGHDADIGVSWETIENSARILFPKEIGESNDGFDDGWCDDN